MKVSVILTSYNHGKYIRQSIDSILGQTYKDFELIIYDDCSSDNSLDIISSYSDERIKVIANSVNMGGGIAQYLIENFVNTELVAVAHSDDFWEKEKLEKQINYLNSHPNVDAVFTYVNVVDEEGMPYTNKEGFYYNIFEKENRSRFQWLRFFFYEGNCLCHPSVLIRKSAYREYGMFSTGLRQTPDFFMWIRLCLNSEIYILEERLTNFRIQKAEKNVSGFRKDTSIRSSIEINLILFQFLEINQCEDFITVFPEAEKYCVKDYFINQYALARLCLQDEMPNYKKAYGLQLLYSLLNNEKQALILKQKYDFGVKDFFELTGKFDVYGVFPNAREYCCNIYFDCGVGYSDEVMLSHKYELWKEKQRIQLEFLITDIDKQKPTKLRIDPIEGVCVRCNVCEFRVNNKEKTLVPLNAYYVGDNGDVFITVDPNYEYVVDINVHVESIHISFEIEQLSIQEIVQNFEREIKELKDWKNLKDLEKNRAHLFGRLKK